MKINDEISKSDARTYEGKIKEVLGNKLADNVSFKDGQTISFITKDESKTAVAIVFEMLKK